jgi:hypothetical protein
MFGMTERHDGGFRSLSVYDSGPPWCGPLLPRGTAPALGASAARSAFSCAQSRKRPPAAHPRKASPRDCPRSASRRAGVP